MEITGTIKHVLETQSGVSSKSGKSWMKQDYVLEVPGQWPSHFVFSVFGEDRISSFALKVGDEVTVSFSVDAHEYNGRWYGENRVYAVRRGADGVSPAAQAAVSGTPSAVGPGTPPVAAAMQEENENLPY